MPPSRRELLVGGALLAGCAATQHPKESDDDDVTPVEDLMREHGVLRRIMYLYDEAIGRLDAAAEVPLDALAGCAKMIRRVIEDYHEQLEEQLLFPRFEKAGVLAELTATLRRQHQTGRALTDRILALAVAPPDRPALATSLRAFNHMYRPHAAREDTVLFPALKKLVGGRAYQDLGEEFEARETKALGEGGFAHAVIDIAALEVAFGFTDLASR